MVRRAVGLVLLVLPVCLGAGTATRPAERDFTFQYGATITGMAPGKVARIWLPEAYTNEDQTVRLVSKPADARETIEPTYGNHLLYVERAAGADGTIAVDCVFHVERREVTGAGPEKPGEAREARRFLGADAKVPVGGKGLALIEGKALPEDPIALGRVLYDAVDDHMQYRKDKPGWGTGDSNWAYDSKFGNCTDFHSLFISLARAEHLPAKFEIGFLLGPPSTTEAKVPGYHCWAKFKPPGKDWMPVDISEANQHPTDRDLDFGTLTSNRVMFTLGRDLVLNPRQAGGPVNFLVYPYVEVDGAVWPQDKIQKRFSYQDDADGSTRNTPRMDMNQ
ncbi:MAG TPA: transglutaminase-like domain-containing protein [Phycisphaerae bacterium]|nr:transglutaminase-like domain-containing protein [Phycisphaerae bacterium]